MEISKTQLKGMFGKTEYDLEFFREMGFIRKKCKVCGNYFWTLDPEKETCGDVECEGKYRFIEEKRWNPSWDIHSTIRKWSEFFRKRGHEVLEPYPVVARWRDDLEFTIASIVAFQPWVTEGLVDPPANPLVIPQPCLRFGGAFSDIDNIGKTGRHLTSFTMGGQHAFNSESKWIYWKNEYVRYNFEFMTKLLGIKPEELTYKEDVWVGGGNFGPSLETFSHGLEIVNGVFMQYSYRNGKVIPLKLKVLDVGWGLERISWFMQRTPTIYEATFGPVFEWLVDQVGVNYDKKLLVEYTKLSGALDISSKERFTESRKMIAKKLGLSLTELDKQLNPIEAIYAILDHTKTIVFAIPDGALPSNVGGAYNLRVILRRAISLAENYNFYIDWDELLNRQIDYFSKSFPRLIEGRDVVTDVWRVETKRYRKTLEKGFAEFLRVIKKKKLRVVGYDVLKHMYLNYGLPPSSLSKLATEQGVELDAPPNFFELVKKEKNTQEMTQPSMRIEDRITQELEGYIESALPTRLLFYEDQYLREFDARIRYIKGKYIVLDQTAFYPRSGGQNNDTGILILPNGEQIRVVNVVKIGKVVIHVAEREVNESLIGFPVKGIIDWDRRITLMRHHTATHVINSAARLVLGPHVWQVGAEKDVDKARLDISHYKNLTREEIMEIEALANKVVMENRPVHIEILDRTSAEKKYGFRIYQGGAIPEKNLRIVTIEKWDSEACGGTHLKSTGEIGLIKIIGTRRIHDGVVRLIFVAGEKALKYIWDEENYLKNACNILRVEPQDLPKTVQRFFDEWKDQQNLIKKLGQTLIDNMDSIIRRDMINTRYGEIFLSRVDIPHELMLEALKRFQQKDLRGILVSTVYGKTMVVCNINDQAIINTLNEISTRFGGSCKALKLGFMCISNLDGSTFLRKIREKLNI